MIQIEHLKNIITAWGETLPFNVRVYLFGSYLKGKPDPSDIDIALEFSTVSLERERTSLWCEFHPNWEKFLSEKFGMKADLELYEPQGKNIPKYLEEASLLLYESQGKVDDI